MAHLLRTMHTLLVACVENTKITHLLEFNVNLLAQVRYHSRKRLAEQRPRVKGQFVRQLQTDPLVGNVDC